MIITTTNHIEIHHVIEYKGIVFGEMISEVNIFKDSTARLSSFFRGHSGTAVVID